MPVAVAAMQNYIRKEQDKFHVAQAEQKKQALVAILEIKCKDCLRVLELDDFSDKYKKQLPALIREHGKDALAETGYITCKMCGPQQAVEQQCARCDVVKSLDEFSKAQRSFHEDAVCITCSKERQEIEPSSVTMARLGLTAEEAKAEWGTPELVASISSSITAASTPSVTSSSPSPLSTKRSKFWNSKAPGSFKRFTPPVKSYSTSASSTVVGNDWSKEWGTASSTDNTSTEPSISNSPALSSIDLPIRARPSSPSTSSLSTNEWTEVATKRMNERRGQSNSYGGGRERGQRGGSSVRGGRGGAWS